MSIQTQIDRIVQNVSDTYSVLENMGATMPEEQNTDNLSNTAANITAVLYGKAQRLTDEQKALAQANIGIDSNIFETKQDKITGTAGQFVVIGDDGNVTTKTIINGEEVSY